MKKILLFFFIFFIISCGNQTKNTCVYTQYDLDMFNQYEDYYTKSQLDSICVADTLDNDLNNWLLIPLKDGESYEKVSLYMYIKTLGEHESIYRVQKINDNLYKITKRIAE